MKGSIFVEIYALRHGHTLWNQDNKIQGITDIPLSPQGILQARSKILEIKSLPVEKILTSPLKRAWDTAKIINSDRKLPIESEPSLREVSFGKWEGLTWEEVKKNYSPLFINNTTGYVNPPGGESFEDAQIRISKFLKELMNTQINHLLVSHKATIRFMIYSLTKKTPAQTGAIEIPNLSIIKFLIEDDKLKSWEFI
ncbi:histidine phosphatase family protein [Alkalibacter mobilis]|uniref:histidine phosphatase family protein n=1 Tax=Alkalibacter mobilis TaxID=2787712 RepID=UPI00189EFABD|nr:histidine phosphatase family protein [Alkalibacter mobilis]